MAVGNGVKEYVVVLVGERSFFERSAAKDAHRKLKIGRRENNISKYGVEKIYQRARVAYKNVL